MSLIRQLNEYGSIAGKFNGAAVRDECRGKVSAGRSAHGAGAGQPRHGADGAFYRPRRRNVRQYVINQDYPQKPFALIPGPRSSLAGRQCQSGGQFHADASPSEMGMLFAWQTLLPWYGQAGARLYGETSQLYAQTSALAWLAMNAEANTPE